MENRHNLAYEILKSGRFVENSKELLRVAKKMGYGSRITREGTEILDNENPLTTIPTKHRKVSWGVSRGILEALAYGKSNFRNGYN